MKCKNCGRDIRYSKSSDSWVDGAFGLLENPKYRHTTVPLVSCNGKTTVEISETSQVLQTLSKYLD